MTKEKNSTGLILVLSFLFLKAGKIFAILKTLKYAKYILTVLSMALSSLLYGFAYGSWTFAIGLVLLIFVHEIGHVIAMIKKGIKASAPVFIPFLGAAVFCGEIKNRDTEAYVGYGGPFIGTLGALACILIAILIGDNSKTVTILHLLGNVGLMINLFNLIPARPLDGGRILHVLGDKVVYLGVSILLLLGAVTQDLFLVFIALVSAWEGKVLEKKVVLPIMSIIIIMVDVDLVISFFLDDKHWLLMTSFTLIYSVASTVLFVATYHVFYPNKKIIGIELKIKKEEDEETEIIPENKSSVKEKIKWLVYYIIITIGIFAIMSWHSQYLPKEVKEHSIVKFVS